MFFIRLTFALCLLCFVAKQSGYIVVKGQEKMEATCECPDNDSEDKENTQKEKLEKLLKLDCPEDIQLTAAIKIRTLIPAAAIHYVAFLHPTISPPPDYI